MQKGKHLISVIVPVYNVQYFLDDCVKSIVEQSYDNLEIVLVDDGSTDSSREKCDKWGLADSRIRVIHQKNAGLSGARNTGISIAKGDYIAFIDSDDWVTKEYLSYLLFLFEDSCSITACNHTVIRNGKGKDNSRTGTEKLVLTRRQAFEEVLFHGCIDDHYNDWEGQDR